MLLCYCYSFAVENNNRFKPAGSLHGVPRDLSLMVFLDSTKNAVAIKEAFHRNIPTIALVNTVNDMSQVGHVAAECCCDVLS